MYVKECGSFDQLQYYANNFDDFFVSMHNSLKSCFRKCTLIDTLDVSSALTKLIQTKTTHLQHDIYFLQNRK